MKRALEEPIRQIAQNAGLEGSVVVEHVRKEKESVGFDAALEKYTDMFEAGIIDPTKVVRCALQNAASVAGLMLTTEVMVTEIPEEKKAPAGGHSHGGGWQRGLREDGLRGIGQAGVREPAEAQGCDGVRGGFRRLSQERS